MSSSSGRHAVVVLLLCAAFAAALGGAVVAAESGKKDGRIPFPPPASHQGDWLRFHGKAVAAGGAGPARPAEECLVCHGRQDCTGCHSMVMPRDHTNFWRTRSHGLMAAGDRERCRTCHQQDYCVRCHSETAPRTHTASWRNRHCGWCHFGSATAPGNNCSVCHRQAPHTSAPHVVGPAINCSLCH